MTSNKKVKNKGKNGKKNKPKIKQISHQNKIIHKSEKYDRKKFKTSVRNETVKNKPGSAFSSKKLLNLSLRERMMYRLKSARFRFINEQLYHINGKDALKYFQQDRDAFNIYHEGYQQQVKQWPINPLHVIIKSLHNKVNKKSVIADFGCGDAELSKTLKDCKVHSFDLVGQDSLVTVCDMSRTPLQSDSVDVAVFCLSLMGTNLNDYLKEANRVLKTRGILKIAEVESRFDNVESFIKQLENFGFRVVNKNFQHNLFVFMDFEKERNIGSKTKKRLPDLVLKPCLYKKR